MKKNIISMIFAICFMVWLFPVNAFAAITVDWRNIESAVDDACHSGENDIVNNGNGWSYTHANDTVTIAEGTTVTGEVNTYFSPDGLGNIQNIHSEGGIFAGTIKGGNFTGTIINNGTINGGTFAGTVTNEGIVSKGTFNIIVNKVIGIVGPKPDVTYNQLINEGNNPNPNPTPGDDGGNTPFPNPGNIENNTSNSKDNIDNDSENIFVEPVVIVVPEGQKYVENVLEQLSVVSTDGKVVIDTEDWYCFNKTLAEKIADRKDVAVTINYKYQGKKYEVTIPAGSDVVSLLDENGFVGFRYLDAVFGGREITE